MIINYLPFIKYIFRLSYKKIIQAFESDLNHQQCPHAECKAYGSLKEHYGYLRKTIYDYDGSEVIKHSGVIIYRYLCSQCNHTHALLTWALPAYGRHTLRLILFALLDYHERKTTGLTVEDISEKYGITGQTLLNWDKRYAKSYILFQRLFRKVQTDIVILLRKLKEYVCRDHSLVFHKFWEECGFGFMTARQNTIRPRLAVTP